MIAECHHHMIFIIYKVFLFWFYINFFIFARAAQSAETSKNYLYFYFKIIPLLNASSKWVIYVHHAFVEMDTVKVYPLQG